jgi:hypothetical protein
LKYLTVRLTLATEIAWGAVSTQKPELHRGGFGPILKET